MLNISKIILWLSILYLAISCQNRAEEDATLAQTSRPPNSLQLTDAQLKNVAIETVKLAQTSMSRNLKAYGQTFYPPENRVTITAPYGGIIKSIQVISGQFVSTGQTIAILEDPRFIDLQQDYLMTKSKLKILELDYERQRDLNDSRATSDKVYQQAENEYRSSQILYKALSEKLKLLGIQPQKLSKETLTRMVNVRAPTSGYIATVNANRGQYVTPSESIADIINQSQPLLRIKIYEKDLKQIHIGLRLSAYSHSDTSVRYLCAVRSINPQLSLDGSAELVCYFLSLNKPIRQNMNMIVDINLGDGSVLSLPESAIVDYEGKSYVFIQNQKNEFTLTSITKGNENQGQIEILNPEDLVSKNIVHKGAYALLMAMKNKE